MSTLTAENVLQLIEQLPAAERMRLDEMLAHSNGVAVSTKAPRDKRVSCKPMPDRTREHYWIQEHRHEYAGQWVALDGDKLIAASSIQQEVWDAVNTDSQTPPPLVLRISSPDDLPYIGI
jgi:hypothetical protein